MLHLDLYGREMDAGQAQVKHAWRVDGAPNIAAKYTAKITGWREYKDKRLVVPVIDPDGHGLSPIRFQVAIWWPDVRDAEGAFATPDSRYPYAQHFSIAECQTGIPIIAAGTGQGGPPYRIFLTDAQSELVSEVASVGWVGAGHITYCPEFTVFEKAETEARPPVPTVNVGEDLANILNSVSNIKAKLNL